LGQLQQKYHELVIISNRNLILIVLEPGKAKIRMSADLVCSEGPLSSSQKTVFPCVVPCYMHIEVAGVSLGLPV
jgi:hypothetical protein